MKQWGLNLKSEKTQCLVIPGVGHYGEASRKLKESNAIEEIKKLNAYQKPIIGICLGAQLLLQGSEEAEKEEKGIGILEGRCIHLDKHLEYKGKIPRVGWEELENKCDSYYFVHSYCMKLEQLTHDYQVETCKTDNVIASIEYKNIYAMQYHPEKSGKSGLEVFKNFMMKHA